MEWFCFRARLIACSSVNCIEPADACCAKELVTNVEPRNARGKHSLAAARSSRRAADADVIIFPLSCWQNLSLMTLQSSSSVAGVNGDDRRESRPQPIEIRLFRENNLNWHSLNDLTE